MTLLWIVAATALGGLLSVTVAAFVASRWITTALPHLVSFSAGMLLSAAFIHVLPEAFESHVGAHALFATLLGGLLFFFLLEKVELFRHSHHHEHDEHDHHHGFDAEQAGRGGWTVLVGDSVHNFCDGVLIAAAFLVSPQIGIVTALAVIAHEIPQEVGDYVVLLNAGFSKAKALLWNALSGLAAVLGGVLGYLAAEPFADALPYFLVVACSSFIYVAVADLIPQLQRRRSLRDAASQVAWIAAGVGLMLLVTTFLHHH